MTKAEFKRKMLRGLGGCVLFLKNCPEPEAYRDIVMYGCTHNPCFDIQCEGTRGWYMYQLISCFDNKTEFIEKAGESLEKSVSKKDMSCQYYCAILSQFAYYGSKRAFEIMTSVHERLFEELKGRCKNPREKAESYEEISIELISCAKNPCEVYADMAEKAGILYLQGKYFKDYNIFDWMYSCRYDYGKARIEKTLRKRAKDSEGLAEYIKRHTEISEKRNRNFEAKRKNEPQNAEEIYSKINEVPIYICRHLLAKGKIGELERLAELYDREADVIKRIKLLRIMGFEGCAVYLPPYRVMEDAMSGNEELRSNAFLALSRMKGKEVKDFAYGLVEKGIYTEEAFYIIANNYDGKDKDFVISFVKAVKDKYAAHGVFSAMLDILSEVGMKNPPKELLPYMYKNGLCTCCREKIIKEMGRRKMLTCDILEESVYDSNEDIRKYALKKLEERKDI